MCQITQSKGDLLMEFILQQVADNCTDFFNFSENKILNDEEIYSFFQLMEDFSTLINGVAIMMLEVFLSKLDDQLYKAAKQEKRYHVQEKSRERTITTQWGEVKIARRYYKDKITGEFVYLLDRVLGLPSHKQVDPYCASKIIKHTISMSYANAVEASTPCQLSRQTVKNLVHSLPTPPTTLQTEIKAKSVETVYIEVDEDHVSLQTGKNINMKLATVYTDKVDAGSNRMELVEKHSFTGLEAPEEFWMQIDSYLAEAYVSTPKVYIIGDGASWIKRGLDVLPNSEFILDRFHLFKYMTKICGKRSRKELFASLETNDKARFEAYVEQMKEKYPHRMKQIIAGATYIENQWDYARASLLRPDIRSSTEAHVSHILSARLSSRPLGWSKKGAETIAKLRVLADNNESIQEFVMSAYRGDTFNYFASVETAKVLSSVKVTAKKMRKPYLYITYSPTPRTGIPGVEKKSNGWLQAIKHGGRRIL